MRSGKIPLMNMRRSSNCPAQAMSECRVGIRTKTIADKLLYWIGLTDYNNLYERGDRENSETASCSGLRDADSGGP